MLFRRIQQQAKGGGGVLDAGGGLGGGEGVEEAVVVGTAVDPGDVAHGLGQDLGEEFLGPLDLIGQKGDGDDPALQGRLAQRVQVRGLHPAEQHVVEAGVLLQGHVVDLVVQLAEDGQVVLAGEGVSVSWLVPNPWDKYVELTYESFNNDDPHLFAGEHADDFVHLLHLKTFFDLSNGSTLEAGLSGATAPSDERHGGRRCWVEGADVTYKWRDPRRGLYRSFLWQTEVLAAQREFEDCRVCSMGLFTAAEYQFARRWLVGGRYDFSERPDDAGLKEHAWSTYLTFLQSEYCFWRLAYQFSRRNFAVAGEDTDHQVFLQLNFGLGPHRAHKY